MKKYLILILFSFALISCGKSDDKTHSKNESVKTETHDHHDHEGHDHSTENTNKEAPHEHKNMDFGNGAYGLVQIDESNAISTNEFVKIMSENDKFEGKVEGTIDAVCQSAGCWVNVKKDDGTTFLVKFNKHFAIPKDLAGKKIYFQGTAENEEISVEELKHFAEDEGLSQEEIDKITTPETKIKFKADGVLVK